MWVKVGLFALALFGIYVAVQGQGLEQECRDIAASGCKLSRDGLV